MSKVVYINKHPFEIEISRDAYEAKFVMKGGKMVCISRLSYGCTLPIPRNTYIRMLRQAYAVYRRIQNEK